jgi:DNA-directed RNA polymerase subunit N (RpoN/RPB10)
MADIADYYEKEKNKIDETNDVDSIYKNFEKIHTGQILDQLGLKRYCCRRNLIANIDMMDII